MIPLEEYTAGHRLLLAAVAKAAGFEDPVAFTGGDLQWTLLKTARKGQAVPVDGTLVRDWTTANRKQQPALRLGARIYEIAGVRFAYVLFAFDMGIEDSGMNFLAVDRKNYRRLFRIALQLDRKREGDSSAPVLPESQMSTLWANTIGYLAGDNLRRLQSLGGRPRRGILLNGEPGNGKTMACRWISEECRRRAWEWRAVTPDSYRRARRSCDPESAVRNLFTVQRRGIIFFDDMDLALRDRGKANDTEDQAVFLTALDGINTKEGVVYVFTSNCSLEMIDRAFKRPGRIDVVLHLQPPDAELRRQLISRWHADIVRGICVETAVANTKAMTYAEIEELKNLLIQHYFDSGIWDWTWARRQFRSNREEFRNTARRKVGFGFAEVGASEDDEWA